MNEFEIRHEEECWWKIFEMELSQESFREFSSEWWKNYYVEITEFASKILSEFQSPKILEAGSGSGKASILAARASGKITLLDISENALKYARYLSQKFKADNVEFVRWNIFEIPYDNDTFEFVWNIGVVEHYGKPDISLILKEMARVAKDGWYVAFGVPNRFFWPTIKAWLLSKKIFRQIPGYRLDTEKFYSENEWLGLVERLSETGVTIESLRTDYFWSSLLMETSGSILKRFEPLNRRFKRNKFLTMISFRVMKSPIKE